MIAADDIVGSAEDGEMAKLRGPVFTQLDLIAIGIVLGATCPTANSSNAKDEEELSDLLQKRTELAQKFGLLLMLFVQQNRDLPSLIEDHRPEQLSLFAHQAMDGSLHWLRTKTNMIGPPKVLEAEEELKEAIEVWAPKFNLIRELWLGASIEESLKLLNVIEERAGEIKEEKKDAMGFGSYVENKSKKKNGK